MNSEAATRVEPTVAKRSGAAQHVHHWTPEEMPLALRLSERLRRFVDWIGRFGSWFVVPLVLITAFDVTMRKLFGKQQVWLVENVSPLFGSTLLQELEWHSHTVLFTLVLGYGYIWNTHVRVDLLRENLAFRKKAWLEFIGLTVFLIPYCLVVVYFAGVYAYESWAINEVSASLVGLSHRWIIKSVLAFGLVMAVVAGVAVWLQVVIALFGPRNVRFPLMTLDWPEEAGSSVEGKERLDLDKAEDQLELRAREQREGEQSVQTPG